MTADQLTAFGLIVAVGAAVAIGSGRLGLGLVLLIFSAVPDLLDGPVAKASGTAGPRGAFFDSVADRVTDSLALGGIGWYLASEEGGHAALLPFAVMAAAALISYERAKAESLGYSAKGGLMERAERMIALCFALAFSALLVPVLWVMLVLTMATAVQRFAVVWKQASSTPTRSRDERWRAWREASEVKRMRARAQLAPKWRTRTRRGRSRRWASAGRRGLGSLRSDRTAREDRWRLRARPRPRP
ncbi:MAG TPA: CDP-alcohol phosphatidyltransferase family protein [Acidimicrobiales bacterium]|nr:CDP-alcohol phosphatidyltransferase family protein [Acidimicrobiales bacterium]